MASKHPLSRDAVRQTLASAESRAQGAYATHSVGTVITALEKRAEGWPIKRRREAARALREPAQRLMAPSTEKG
jgi:hypothetical protein